MPNNLWVYKCNRNEQDFAQSTGDWKQFFQNSRPCKWGGSHSTSNAASIHIINKQMMPGDLVLAYQTDERALIGMCRVVKLTGGPGDRSIWLKPVDRFDEPIKIHELKSSNQALQNVKAFRGGFPQTLYAVSKSERRVLEAICGVNLNVGTCEPVLPTQKRVGAGFGNAETNRLVEKAAVNAVTEWYRRRQWVVKSVEQKKCGYDLQCRKGGVTEYVEVKGVSGSEPRFIITAAELRQALSNPAFVIWIVTAAQSKHPITSRLSGRELQREFTFQAIQYTAHKK